MSDTIAKCPICGGDIDTDDLEFSEGDPADCDNCGASLVVVAVEPLNFAEDDDPYPEEDEDDDDGDDEDDEDEDDDEDDDEDEDEDDE